MNQNLPPNAGQSGENVYDQGQGNNPYYASQQQSQAQPDLDAGAPQLKTVDSQRINRKALMFLGGIVVLLVMMIVMFMKNTSANREENAAKPREEKVVIPDLPKSAGQGADPEFAELSPEPAPVQLQELPPLPPEDPQNGSQAYRDDQMMPAEPRGPSLVERRMGMTENAGAAGSSQSAQLLQVAMAAQQNGAGGQAQTVAPLERDHKVSIAQYLRSPDTLMVRGTYIRCVLETRIVTDYAGYTSCVVTEPVYSMNGKHLLLPKGSKALGRYQGEPNGPRVAVLWDRITTPNGIDVALEGPGVDNLGGAGHPGDYNGHWFSKMSSALMISIISDAFKYAAAKNGPTTTLTNGSSVVEMPFDSNTAKTMEKLAGQALSKANSRPATVTINQGTVLNIYVAKDVDFSSVVARR